MLTSATFYYCSFQATCTGKTLRLSGIRTRVVRESKHADHLTTTIAQTLPMSLSGLLGTNVVNANVRKRFPSVRMVVRLSNN